MVCQGWRHRNSSVLNYSKRRNPDFSPKPSTQKVHGRHFSGIWQRSCGDLGTRALRLNHWLQCVRDEVLQELASACQTLGDDWAILGGIFDRTRHQAEIAGMTPRSVLRPGRWWRPP